MKRILQALSQRNLPRRKTTHNWQPGLPYPQPYYAYSESDKRWRAILPPATPPKSASSASPSKINNPLTQFSIYSWNIDFRIPLGPERMQAALNHVRSLVVPEKRQQHDQQSSSHSSYPRPRIIFFQEMTSSDLRVIQSQPWVRANYYVTDITDEFWDSTLYGTCTLIPKTLDVRAVFRVHYPDTAMQRDGLFVDVGVDVDIDVGPSASDAVDGGANRGYLRLCNTHLESLVFEPAMRPPQMRCAARFMRGEGEVEEHSTNGKVLGSVLGGDLNAIQEFDKTLPMDNGLKDSYLALGGEEGREDCFTWGQMASTRERTKFGLSRMDKLLFCGQVKVEKFERFGYDVVVEEGVDGEQLIQMGMEKPWVTDHLGVMGDFSIEKFQIA